MTEKLAEVIEMTSTAMTGLCCDASGDPHNGCALGTSATVFNLRRPLLIWREQRNTFRADPTVAVYPSRRNTYDKAFVKSAPTLN